MKLLSFELTMPNVGSWNGKWTGEDRKYYVIRKLDNKVADKIMEDSKSRPIYQSPYSKDLIGYTPERKSYYYNFGDGWGASIIVERVDSREANRRRSKSSGFCGYEWMIDSIICHGEILNSNQRNELLNKG